MNSQLIRSRDVSRADLIALMPEEYRTRAVSSRTDDLAELLQEALAEQSGKRFHTSDCATSVAPAFVPGPCDCDAPADDSGLYRNMIRIRINRFPYCRHGEIAARKDGLDSPHAADACR